MFLDVLLILRFIIKLQFPANDYEKEWIILIYCNSNYIQILMILLLNEDNPLVGDV